MKMHDPQRVEAIRSQVKAQLEVIAGLREKIGPGDLRMLRIARSQTQDIEDTYLSHIGVHWREPELECWWLDAAERMLGVWAPQLAALAKQWEHLMPGEAEVFEA